jgi:hypothetical protein
VSGTSLHPAQLSAVRRREVPTNGPGRSPPTSPLRHGPPRYATYFGISPACSAVERSIYRRFGTGVAHGRGRTVDAPGAASTGVEGLRCFPPTCLYISGPPWSDPEPRCGLTLQSGSSSRRPGPLVLPPPCKGRAVGSGPPLGATPLGGNSALAGSVPLGSLLFLVPRRLRLFLASL